jgi:uncharacterized protein YkwD
VPTVVLLGAGPPGVPAINRACRPFTSHTGSEGSSVADRVEEQVYAWSWISDNPYVTGDAANGAPTAFDKWMNSAPQR